MKIVITTPQKLMALLAGMILISLSYSAISGNDDTVVVNVDNFVRAETADQFERLLEMMRGIYQ